MSVGARHAIVGGINGYRLILRPMLGGGCRFVPTCSEYAIRAVNEHGVRTGVWLATKRISRCHPWGAAGFDPVPPKEC